MMQTLFAQRPCDSSLALVHRYPWDLYFDNMHQGMQWGIQTQLIVGLQIWLHGMIVMDVGGASSLRWSLSDDISIEALWSDSLLFSLTMATAMPSSGPSLRRRSTIFFLDDQSILCSLLPWSVHRGGAPSPKLPPNDQSWTSPPKWSRGHGHHLGWMIAPIDMRPI